MRPASVDERSWAGSDSLAAWELVHGIQIDGSVLLTLAAAQEHDPGHRRRHSALKRMHSRTCNLRRACWGGVDACKHSNSRHRVA